MALFVLGCVVFAIRGPWFLKGLLWTLCFYLQMKASERQKPWIVGFCALGLLLFAFRFNLQAPQILQEPLLPFVGAPIMGYVGGQSTSGFDLHVKSPNAEDKGEWFVFRVNVYKPPAGLEGGWVTLKTWKLQPFDQVNSTGFQQNAYYASRRYDGALRASASQIQIQGQTQTQVDTSNISLKRPFFPLVRWQIQSFIQGRLATLHPLSQQWLRTLILGDITVHEGFGKTVKALGVLHLVVVSGFHYALILQLFKLVTNPLIRRRKWTLLVDGLMALLVYLAVAPGFGSDRAFVKVQSRSLAFWIKRDLSGHRGLLLTMSLWLLAYPSALSQVGFQITFVATASLVLLSESDLFYYSKIKTTLLKATLESAFVVIFVVPILMAQFVQQPILQLLATVVLSPLIAGLILLGVIYVLVGYFFMGDALRWLIQLLCEQSQQGIDFLSLGGTQTFELPYCLTWLFAAFAIGTLWLWCWPRGRSALFKGSYGTLRGLGVALVLIGVLGICRVDFGLSVRSFALRDGEAYLIRAPGATVVYDVSNDPAVVIRLKQAGVHRIDLLIISHDHQDHMGQLELILSEFKVVELVKDLHSSGLGSGFVGSGELQLSLGDLKLRLGQPKLKSNNVNDNSIAVMGQYEKRHFLLTGDLEEAGMAWLIKDFWRQEKLDLLKIPHHGSYLAQYPQWLAQLDPQMIWISGGRSKRVNKVPLKSELLRQKRLFYDTMEHGELYWGVWPWPIR